MPHDRRPTLSQQPPTRPRPPPPAAQASFTSAAHPGDCRCTVWRAASICRAPTRPSGRPGLSYLTAKSRRQSRQQHARALLPLLPPRPRAAVDRLTRAASMVTPAACSSSRGAPAAQRHVQQRRRRQRHMQAASTGGGGGASTRQAPRCSAAIKFAKYQGLGNDFILVRATEAPLVACAARAAPSRLPRHSCFSLRACVLATPAVQVDNRHQAEPVITPEQAVKLCDRNFGIGGDGVRRRCAGAACCWLPACCRVTRALLPPGLQVIFALPAENGTDYSMRIFNSDGSEPEMCGNGIRCLARFVAGERALLRRANTTRPVLGQRQTALRPHHAHGRDPPLRMQTSTARRLGSTRSIRWRASSSRRCWPTARCERARRACQPGSSMR